MTIEIIDCRVIPRTSACARVGCSITAGHALIFRLPLYRITAVLMLCSEHASRAQETRTLEDGRSLLARRRGSTGVGN